ncbi:MULTISPECIES: bile acid:sodium symporter family protein [Corynebacterium]|uniref:bile acid:sodium symporter family protein n=1 Tax=Corynebacterium TaxID=1716 RepID=UPI00223BB72F|nr:MULTISPECIES: bile acid:sodium symporter family protein [Corynebacterium]MCT2189034.1 bile acid:sodium symporter [Corynebacterium kefirresidentii]MDK8586924.1 bile acid:sodium symporter family protein [Corynebacterium kefirresidentii]MDU4569677.1 bile acid:sodium symporter family protein [Corynebacterium sp.]MDU6013023.1 bile acid:sodium symporter family protein [Corynebacterium sp.]MDU7565212.1 bile acid:sodium symporter family protein [Corynebacterium sp.]
MLQSLKKPDPLIVLIILAVILAVIAPARGDFAETFGQLTNVAIAFLFFLYGARLSTQEALNGLKHWRLHLTILAFTFVVYPLIGIALRPLTAFISHDMYLGILFLTLVPSTVQSSVAFTSIAKGNVAGAIVSASTSNLVGVFITPSLVMLLMGTGGGVHIDTSVFGEIALLLLAPFILGQLTRRWVGKFAQSKATKVVDRGSIAMVVYSAFSKGVVDGIWSSISIWELAFLVAFAAIFVAFMLWLTKKVSEKLGFKRADTVAIEFCGSKKSLATGLPMASVIFASGGTSLGLLILPLMIYHQVQLMMCSWLASRYAQRATT